MPNLRKFRELSNEIKTANKFVKNRINKKYFIFEILPLTLFIFLYCLKKIIINLVVFCGFLREKIIHFQIRIVYFLLINN